LPIKRLNLLATKDADGKWRLRDEIVRSSVVFEIKNHVWEASVSGEPATVVSFTDNLLQLRIVGFQRLKTHDEFSLQFVYRVKITKRAGQ